MKARIVVPLVVGAVAIGLGACGGGGGGGGGGVAAPVYSGSNSPATIDASNATKLSGSVYAGTAGPSAAGTVAKPQSGQQKAGSDAAEAAALAKQLVDGFLSGVSSKPSSLTGVTVAGPCGGTASGTATDNPAAGTAHADITYTDYCQSSQGIQTISNGHIVYDKTTAGTTVTLSFTFDPVKITANGALSVYAAGAMTLSSDSATNIDTFNIPGEWVSQDAHGVTIKMSGVNMTMQSGLLTNLTGRVFDPQYGYVDVDTVPDFGYALSCAGGYPDSGVMTMNGANNTVATVTPQNDCLNVNVCYGVGAATTCNLQPWSQL